MAINEYRSRTMLASYLKDASNFIKRTFPEMSKEDRVNYLKKIIKNNFHNFSVYLDDTLYNFSQLDKAIVNQAPIIAGSGTLYARHDQVHNDRAGMIEVFSNERAKEKKIMFEHINDEDQTEHNKHDNNQRAWKVMNNSYYGVLNEKHSQFFDQHSGMSITTSAQDLITTALNTFEKFLGGDVILYNMGELIQYCNRIVNEEYTDDSPELKYNKDLSYYTTDLLYDHLSNYFEKDFNPNDSEIDLIKELLDEYSPEARKRIYYKNNLLGFFKDTNFIDLFFKPITQQEDLKEFMDANKPPKDIKPYLDEAWNNVKCNIFYDYQDFNRFKNASEQPRRIVLIVDTDSTFLYLKDTVTAIFNSVPEIDFENDIKAQIAIVNSVMYIITKVSTASLERLARECGVPEEYKSLLNMKNEFLSTRLLLTDNKKQYAQSIVLQEGNYLENPNFDIKGMALRKTSTNSILRDAVTKLLKEDVLTSKSIPYGKIIKYFQNLSRTIESSLRNGEQKYLIPAKVNNAEAYKNPYRIAPFKGMIVWNSFFPEDPITPPTKISYVKLNITDFSQITDNKDLTPQQVEIFKELWSNKDLIGGTGLNICAIGNTKKPIPDFIRPYISIDDMVSTHMKNLVQMLESLGINIINIKTKQFPSNLVKI